MIKLFAVFALTGFMMVATTVVGAGVYLVTGGVAMCQVETPEVDITVPVPTRLADVGLVVARLVVPLVGAEEDLQEARRQVEPWMPLIEVAGRELAAVEDGTTLLSVRTAEETVLVERRRGRFYIDVHAPDADVHVSIPARSFRRLAGNLSFLL